MAEAGLDDVDLVSPYLAHGTRVTGSQRIDVLILDHFETAAVRVSPGGRAPVPVGSWAAEIGAQAATNANWFSASDGFDGPFVADGTVYGGRDHHYTALFGFTAEKRLVPIQGVELPIKSQYLVVESVSQPLAALQSAVRIRAAGA